MYSKKNIFELLFIKNVVYSSSRILRPIAMDVKLIANVIIIDIIVSIMDSSRDCTLPDISYYM